jgi:hypothetical protein
MNASAAASNTVSLPVCGLVASPVPRIQLAPARAAM